MTIDTANLKFYRSVAIDGGGIGTELMTSSLLNNEFDRITVLERQTGTIKYSKQFLKNDNADDWSNVKIYLPATTLNAPYTGISVCLAGSKSLLNTSATLSGTAIVTASGWFTTSSDLRLEIGQGELVFNSTDDTISDAVPVLSVASTYIVLESPYFGTVGGSSKQLSVGPAYLASFIYPRSTSALVSPAAISIPAGQAMGMWKRYTTVVNCPPFTNDWFTIAFEEV